MRTRTSSTPGHSLAAVAITSRVKEAFGVDVAADVLYDHPRLEDFVGAVSRVIEGHGG